MRLQTHTRNMSHILFLHGNSGFQNAPQYNVYTYIASLVTFHVHAFNSYFRIIEHRRTLLKFLYEMFYNLLSDTTNIKVSSGVCLYLHYSFTDKNKSTVNNLVCLKKCFETELPETLRKLTDIKTRSHEKLKKKRLQQCNQYFK
jgi:hypothetical protein